MGINIPFLYQVAIYVLILSAINGIIFYLLRDKTQSYYMPKFLRNILKKVLTIKEPESSGFMQCEMGGTDENAKLVIKSIGAAKHGFKNFGDIVNETNLSLDIINHTLDWLVMHKFATEANGRRGKIYELSPKGRDSFTLIINPKT